MLKRDEGGEVKGERGSGGSSLEKLQDTWLARLQSTSARLPCRYSDKPHIDHRLCNGEAIISALILSLYSAVLPCMCGRVRLGRD